MRVGAFEQLFGPGRGELNKNFPKIQMPGGCPGGGVLKLRFDLYIRLFVFNLLLLNSVWRIFYPHLSWRDFSFKCFQIKSSHLWPFIPNSCQVIVRCPTFLFSKRVRSLVELWIYFNYGKCLAVEHNLVKNPNWREADQLAIYKR